jgi:chromate transporter
MIPVLLQLAGLFALLSVLSVGGGNGVLPDMQRAAVDVHHWMSGREFLDFFALSRAAPGPNSLLVVLIGQHAAGIPGALVAFVAMFGPSCLIVHLAVRLWRRQANASWRTVVERALAPVSVGLTIGAGLSIARGTEHDWQSYAVTATSTVVLASTEIHPLLMLAGGGALLLLSAYG